MEGIPVHNMLGLSALYRRSLKIFSDWIFPVSVAGLALAAFTWNAEQVFFQQHVYFTDGDCYARMTRVRMLLDHPLSPIHEHEFENYPVGTRPHTTAPLDYIILGLAAVMGRFSSEALSLAGAWISPVLGLATIVFLAFWGRGRPFGGAPILVLAVSPIVSHGFLLGRPDHQSLLMLLVVVALAAEVDMWSGKARGRLSAVAWALALWVSLFEPLILLAFVMSLRVLARRFSFACRPFAIFLAILFLGFLVDGLHVAAFDSHFGNWALNIGELRHGAPGLLFHWAGWLTVVAPFGLIAAFFRKKEPACLLLAALVVLLTGLTLWHVRWGYFYVLIFALSLPSILPLARWKFAGWGILVLSLWPVAANWESTLYPDDSRFRARAEAVADSVALRDAAIRIKDLPVRGVIAPWWFSPAIVWWSGQPCVAGTSHQSLPGIVDVSEFFLSEGSGNEILEKRKAGYIFSYEPDRVISNSAQILARPEPSSPLARRLYNHPRGADFPMRYANRFFKVFEVPQK